MKINPILSKELKLNARTIKLPLVLMVYNLVLSCVAILSLSGIQSQYESGFTVEYGELIGIFQILGWIQCVLVCFMVPILTASSIAGERERQTLDIMLSTSIRPFQIVLGKLMASMCTVCILVISSIPILSTAFIFGGVDWKYMLYFLFIIISIGIYAGSAGIFFSTLVKKTPVAIGLTFLFLIFVIVGTMFILPMIDHLWRAFFYDSVNDGYIGTPPDIRWGSLVLLVNPMVLFFDFMEKSSGGAGVSALLPELFGVSVGGRIDTFAEQKWLAVSVIVQLFIAFCFLIISSWVLNPLRSRRPKKEKQYFKKKRRDRVKKEKNS